MAFVTRSERKMEKEIIKNNTNLGPGEYEDEGIKQEARLLHKISSVYTHMTKKNNLQINIPFNSTCKRGSLSKMNNTPGPGAYTNIYSYTKKNTKEELPSLNKEIIFIEENGNLIPKFKNESKGFLSSEKRFNNIFDSNNNENIGPGCYHTDTDKNINKIKIHNTRYQNIGNKIAKSLDNYMPTIPDKNRGDFKFINGEIKEIKKKVHKDNEIGPGQYNLYPKWDSKAIDWNQGLKKVNKSDNFKNELINSLNEKNNSVELKLNFYNSTLKKLNKSFKKNITKSPSNGNILGENQNNSIRNLVFKRFLKDRKKLHMNSLSKLKEYNDIILDIKYKDTPGPGFYDNKIIKGPISIFNSNKTQNFGSNTPQFFKINSNNEYIGPGSYFLEKNKYEPKFETVMHIKKPEKKYQEKKKDIGIFIYNFRKNNKNKQPVVGQYDLEKNFIKKEISNVKSFGILEERFKTNKPKEEIEIDEDEKEEKQNSNNNISKINYDEKIKNKIDSKYLELKKKEEEEEKKKREKYRDIKEPPVGAYSPEIITSMSYNVFSKLNPYRNKIAPFNIMNIRFKNELNIRKQNSELPGPGNYEVSDAYNALYNSKKTYNVFGAGSQRNNNKNNLPGPGLYEPSDPNSLWNKKTFNILFMDKSNSL